MSHTDILNLLDTIENEDENLEKLERAMEFYCGTWDKCAGYKCALVLTLTDQYEHHASEQDPADLEKLKTLLTE